MDKTIYILFAAIFFVLFIVLFFANRFIKSETLERLDNIAGILAFLSTIVFVVVNFFVPSINANSGDVSSNNFEPSKRAPYDDFNNFYQNDNLSL